MQRPTFLIEEACPSSSYVTYKFRPSDLNDSEVKMIWMDGGIRPSHPDLITDKDDIGDNGVLMIGQLNIDEVQMVEFCTFWRDPEGRKSVLRLCQFQKY